MSMRRNIPRLRLIQRLTAPPPDRDMLTHGPSSRHRQGTYVIRGAARKPDRRLIGRLLIGHDKAKVYISTAVGKPVARPSHDRLFLRPRAVNRPQARRQRPGGKLMAAAALVYAESTGQNIPRASARHWYSAYGHMAIERKTNRAHRAHHGRRRDAASATAEWGTERAASERPVPEWTTRQIAVAETVALIPERPRSPHDRRQWNTGTRERRQCRNASHAGAW